MAVKVKNRKGRNVILLDPWEKGNKMFNELQNDVHLTNDGLVKTKKNGKPKKLNDTQKAYRSGYLAAQKDSRKCYKHNKRNSPKSPYVDVPFSN